MITYLQLTDDSISLTLNSIYLRYWGPPHKGCPGTSIYLNPALDVNDFSKRADFSDLAIL